MATQIEVALGRLHGIGREAQWGDIGAEAVRRAIESVARHIDEPADYRVYGTVCVYSAGVYVVIFDGSVWRVSGAVSGRDLLGPNAKWRALSQADI